MKRVTIIPTEKAHIPIKDTKSKFVGQLTIDRCYYIESELAQGLIDLLMNKPLVIESKEQHFLNGV